MGRDTHRQIAPGEVAGGEQLAEVGAGHHPGRGGGGGEGMQRRSHQPDAVPRQGALAELIDDAQRPAGTENHMLPTQDSRLHDARPDWPVLVSNWQLLSKDRIE